MTPCTRFYAIDKQFVYTLRNRRYLPENGLPNQKTKPPARLAVPSGHGLVASREMPEQEAPETSGLLLLHHAEGAMTPHEVGASRVGGLDLKRGAMKILTAAEMGETDRLTAEKYGVSREAAPSGA